VKYRQLGRTEMRVGEVGYGAWGIGGSQWLGGNDRESTASLRRAIELGLNFIDTALAYGDGHSEQLISDVLRDCQQKIYVATKVPPKNLKWPARPGIGIGEVFPYDYVMSSTERSLKNLRMETVDLQQLHVWNPEWLGHDDWKRAFEELKRSGKAKAVGVSINDHQPDSALDLIRTGLIDTVQVIYNIWDQSPERSLFPLALEKKVGVLARVPLDEGSLTGRLTEDTEFPPGDFRNRYFREGRKREVVERVDRLTADLGITEAALPQVALRFCLSHPAVTTVIPGMRSPANVESNCAVSELGPLPPAMLERVKRHAWERNFYA
jgi:aryl-alcohol dehydrogenase-like predicted oxidoreductase